MEYPKITLISGPRNSGKTTIARERFPPPAEGNYETLWIHPADFENIYALTSATKDTKCIVLDDVSNYAQSARFRGPLILAHRKFRDPITIENPHLVIISECLDASDFPFPVELISTGPIERDEPSNENANLVQAPIWKSIQNTPPGDGVEVLLFSAEWIDEDFNPTGVRPGFAEDNASRWVIARWSAHHHEYITDHIEVKPFRNGLPTHWASIHPLIPVSK